MAVREVKGAQLGKLITVRGIVTRVSFEEYRQATPRENSITRSLLLFSQVV